jgi:hypothetical protein
MDSLSFLRPLTDLLGEGEKRRQTLVAPGGSGAVFTINGEETDDGSGQPMKDNLAHAQEPPHLARARDVCGKLK